VVFSFQRYKGAGKKVYQEKIAAAEALDAHRVRFRLREPQLTLRVVSIPTTYWLELPAKWDP
jgi:hypothetical protein